MCGTQTGMSVSGDGAMADIGVTGDSVLTILCIAGDVIDGICSVQQIAEDRTAESECVGAVDPQLVGTAGVRVQQYV
jgi:hypothetical protein